MAARIFYKGYPRDVEFTKPSSSQPDGKYKGYPVHVTFTRPSAGHPRPTSNHHRPAEHRHISHWDKLPADIADRIMAEANDLNKQIQVNDIIYSVCKGSSSTGLTGFQFWRVVNITKTKQIKGVLLRRHTVREWQEGKLSHSEQEPYFRGQYYDDEVFNKPRVVSSKYEIGKYDSTKRYIFTTDFDRHSWKIEDDGKRDNALREKEMRELAEEHREWMRNRRMEFYSHLFD